MMIRKVREIILRPGIAEKASLAGPLKRHLRLVVYTHFLNAAKHALTKGPIKNLFIAMSRYPSAPLPAMSGLRRRMPPVCRRAVRRVATAQLRPGKTLRRPRLLGEWSCFLRSRAPWNGC